MPSSDEKSLEPNHPSISDILLQINHAVVNAIP